MDPGNCGSPCAFDKLLESISIKIDSTSSSGLMPSSLPGVMTEMPVPLLFQMSLLSIPFVGPIAWLVVLLVAFLFGPFPYWPSFFLICWFVLTKPMPIKAKLQQVGFLLVEFLATPFRTFFWYLDELLFPGYRDIVIEPVFIIGGPRCGTTLLHRTLANAEQDFFAVRHLEWRFPCISIQLLIDRLGLSQFLGGIRYWPDSSVGDLAARMHPNRLDDWEEDGIFFEELFCHHLFIFLRFPYPELLAPMDSFASLPASVQRKMLGIHRKVIQKVAYIRKECPRFYLSKEVAGNDKISLLLQFYPNARFIVLVRESKDFMSSLLPLLKASTSAKNAGYDPSSNPAWFPVVHERMQRDCAKLVTLCNEVIPPQRQMGLYSISLFDDIEITVERIYSWLELTLDDRRRQELASLSRKQSQRNKGYHNPVEAYEGFENYDALVQSYAEARHKL